MDASVRGGQQLRVEIVRRRQHPFRTVGDLGVSPVGQFQSWREEPPAVREAFDRVLACVRDDPGLDLREGTLAPRGERSRAVAAATRVPWLALLGAVFALFGCARAHTRGRTVTARELGRRSLVTPAALCALAVATLVGRALLVPAAFLHQNGQGPLWVDQALGAPSIYGPGYAEMFGLLASAAHDPDRAIFSAQSVLSALVAPCMWLVARRCGARAPLAYALAIAVALEPAFARIAASESYFATIAALLALGGAALAVGAWPGRVRDASFVPCAVAAGLFAAQAVRIHPIGAVPAALLPLVALVGRGSLRARLRVASVSVLIVGAISIASFVDAFGDLTGGALGERWMPSFTARLAHEHRWGEIALTVLATIGVGALSRRPGRGALRALVLCAVILVASVTDMLGTDPEILHVGYRSLLLAPGAAALAATISGLRLPATLSRHSRLVPAIVLSIAIAGMPARWALVEELPTDARELAHLLAWRESIPVESTVAYVGAVGRRRLFLPMHGDWTPMSPASFRIGADERAPDLRLLGSDVYYYRSSLCASPEGEGFCDDLEGLYRLERVRSAALPSIPSERGLGYEGDVVHVTLFRVAGRR